MEPLTKYTAHMGKQKEEEKQIEWALYVLNNGAWWDDIDDDASDADMSSLYDAIDIVNDVLKRLVFDSCSNGEEKEEEK